MKFIFFFLHLLTYIFCDCGFNTFNDTILSMSNQLKTQQIFIDEVNIIFGFAVWTKYVVYNFGTSPQQNGELYDWDDYENENDEDYEQEDDEDEDEDDDDDDDNDYENKDDGDVDNEEYDGQLIMSLVDSVTNRNHLILYLKPFGTINESGVQHTLLYIKPDGTRGEINSKLDTLNYEGNWVLNFISINRETHQLEFLQGGPLQNSIEYFIKYVSTFTSNSILVTLGGQGKLQFKDKIQNFAGFRGYLSKLIYVDQFLSTYNDVEKYLAAKNCMAQNECSQQIAHSIVSGISVFDGEKELHTQIFQTGTNYAIQFWVKLDLSQVDYSTYILVFRARTNKDYYDFRRLGDRSILFKYFIDGTNSNFSFQLISVYQYQFPKMTIRHQQNGNPRQKVRYFGENQIFERIQKWHYVVFCQEVYSQKQLFIVYYPHEQIERKWNLQNSEIYRQFSNTQVYFDIGVDKFHNQQKFQGQIANFKFLNCVPSDYDYTQKCHPVCKQCVGPSINDCSKCFDNQNRVYSLDGSTCVCIEGYCDNGVDYQCIKFNREYEIIQYKEISSEQQQKIEICPFSYVSTNRIDCVDCLRNYKQWLKEPLCKSDLVRLYTFGQQYPYNEMNRDESQIELFRYDDQNQLHLCVGCLSICQDNYDNCFWQDSYGQWIKCKPNYFFFNHQCNLCSDFCQSCDSTGLCLQCSSKYYLNSEFNQCLQCPINCNECIYNSQTNQIECTSCFPQESLFEGKCYRCGQYCEICMFDQIVEKDGAQYQINRCLKCIDPSKYFISFDAVNCLVNDIPNCLYAFQYYKPDRRRTTMDFRFKPSPLDNRIGTACARCINQFIYYLNDNQNECVKENTFCILQFSDPEFNNEIFKIIGSYRYSKCFKALERFGKCQYNHYPLLNCKGCIQPYKGTIQKCTHCINRYYAERINGLCTKCLLKNCLLCVQQMKINQDAYILQMQAFYEHFVNFDGSHPFEEYAQSQNLSDYEIICSKCEPGYTLTNNYCVKKCPDNCQECETIDGQILCLRCFETQQGQALTLHNGECIQCPYNCALCLVRDQSVINGINPYFNSQQYIQFTHLCLKPFDSIESLSYDTYTGQYSQCLNYEQCQKQWIIERNLYCSQQEFDSAQKGLNKKQIREFKQRNILLSQLLSNIDGTHIPEIENDIVYLEANKQQISALILRYMILGDQKCNISGQKKVGYGQYFSQHVFTLTNVSLELFASQRITLKFTNSISFNNFTSITIKNIQFQQVKAPSQIIFNNIKKTQVFIINCTFISNDQFQIQLRNVTHLEFVNNSIINSSIKREKFGSIIYINSDDSFELDDNELIQFKNLMISDSYFANLQFFEYNTKVPCMFENITVHDSQLDNLNFFSLAQIQFSLTTLIIYNCQVKDSQSLFIFNQQYKISFKDVFIDQLNLTNSTFIYSTTDIIIYSGSFTNSLLNDSSKFLYVENYNNQKLNLELTNISFQNNSFHHISHLIEIQDAYHVYESSLLLINLTFYNQSRFKFDDVVPALEDAMILINISQIKMFGISVYRAFGITEFVYLSTDSLSIQSFTAQLIDSLQFKGLHQHLDCVEKQVDVQSIKPLLNIIEPIKTNMSNLTLNNLIIVDQPLITLQQSYHSMSSIQLTNWKVTNNLLLATSVSRTTALFYVKSIFKIDIVLQKITFSENILNQFVIEQATTSSVSFSFQCPLCTCSIEGFILTDNLITNSSSSIVYLQVKSVFLSQSTFFYNNILTYRLIERHLIKGFTEQFNLTFPILEQLFPVSSSGIFKLISEQTRLQQIKCSSNFGIQGGCFSIITSNKGQIQILDSEFVNISNGGSINIENSQSELDLEIHNVLFKYIYNIEQGSIVTISPSSNKIIVQISSSQLIGSESLQGNLISLQQTQYNEHSIITLNNLTITSNKESFLTFLGLYKDFSTDDINNIIQKRYQIFIEDIKMNINEVSFNGLYFSKIFSSKNSIISINNLLVRECEYAFNLITISQDKYIHELYLSNIRILGNLEFVTQLKQSICETTIDSQQEIYMQCQTSDIEDDHLENTNYENVRLCRLETLLNSNFSTQSLISLDLQSNTSTQKVLSEIEINYVLLYNNSGSNYLNGLFNVDFINNLYKIKFNQLNFIQNLCGNGGCLSLNSDKTSQQSRILNQILNSITQAINVKIMNSKFVNNTIYNGGCIQMGNVQFLMENSIILNNAGTENDTSGLIIIGSQPYLLLNNQLENNTHQNVKLVLNSLNDQQLSLNTNFHPSIVPQAPCQLQIKLKEQSPLFLSSRVYYDDKLAIDEVNENQLTNISQEKFILLPSGMKISQYSQFHLQSISSIKLNISLTLVPTNQYHQIMTLSENVTCDIKSRKIAVWDSRKSDVNFLDEKHINLNEVQYSSNYNGFNLNDLIIYFDPETPDSEWLQLQFYCNSIKIDLFSKDNLYYPEGYHKNYYFRINIRTLPCQLGEIKNHTTNSCQTCDYTQGFYSIRLNATQCTIQNTDYITNITQNNIQVKKGYWRQNYTNPMIEQCKNLQENCLGGWNFGDDSCFAGHIGALCEECDIYNTRGQGQYSTDNKYSCGLCQESYNNIIIFFLISIWTFIQVTITVKATYEFTQQLIQRRQMLRLALIFANEDCQAGVLIKFLSTYFQIIGSLTSFQINIPNRFNRFIQTVGNPIQTMIYTFDCVIVNISSIEIVYMKVIWELLMPLLYLIIFVVCSFIIFTFTKNIQKKGLIITGTIYLFLFFQPNLIGSLMSVISYRHVDGIKWIQGNMAYLYDKQNHYLWVYVLACLTGFIGILIPGLIVYKLYHNRNKLQSLRFRKLHGYLYNEYRHQAYLWEILKLALKDLIIVILIFYQDIILMKGILILIVLQIYLILIFKFRPYQIGYLNDLELQLIFICQISIIIGFCLYLLDHQQFYQPQILFFLILCLLNSYLFLYLLSKLIKAYQEKLQVYVEKVKGFIKQNFPNFINRYPSMRESLKDKSQARQRACQNYRKLFKKLQNSEMLSKRQSLQELNSEILSQQKKSQVDFQMDIKSQLSKMII